MARRKSSGLIGCIGLVLLFGGCSRMMGGCQSSAPPPPPVYVAPAPDTPEQIRLKAESQKFFAAKAAREAKEAAAYEKQQAADAAAWERQQALQADLRATDEALRPQTPAYMGGPGMGRPGVVSPGYSGGDSPSYRSPRTRRGADSVQKSVNVRSYTRKDGTFVSGHSRRPPKR